MSRRSENPSSAIGTKLAPQGAFPADQRRLLLGIAHRAILARWDNAPLPEPYALPAELSEPRGVFTTLYLRSGELGSDNAGRQLRGCVGYAMPIAPLYRAVAETARVAAFEDSRFPPVSREEAAELDISLSVLSPMCAIHPDVVEVGRHGLLISEGDHRGLLLPQVAVEHGWDREQFLGQTCRKAGLPLDAWRKSATLQAFTAEVFGDADVD